MKISLCQSILLLALAPVVLVGREIQVLREDAFDFALRTDFLEQGHIQFFYEVIDKDEDAATDCDFRKVQALDRRGVYQPGKHHVVVARSAYVVDQPIGFFSEERLTDVKYIDAVTGFDDFVRPSGYPLNQIRKEGEIFVPSMDFVIHTYSPITVKRKPAEDLAFYREILAMEEGLPTPAISLEYDYRNFGRVFFAEIIAGARTVVHHYPFGEGRTLVVSTMLNFLYRLPPSLRAMESETRERAIDLILRTENYQG